MQLQFRELLICFFSVFARDRWKHKAGSLPKIIKTKKRTREARKRMVLADNSSRLPSQRHSNASCKVQTICELQFHVNGVPRPCHKVTLYRVPRQRGRPRHERGLCRSANHEFDSWKRDAFTFVPGCTGKMKSTRTIAAPSFLLGYFTSAISESFSISFLRRVAIYLPGYFNVGH